MDRVKYMHREIGGIGSLSEMVDEVVNEQRPKHGDNWGRWKLNGYGGSWSVDLEGYCIRLDDITSNAKMNDWIFQMAGKSWVTADDLGNLIYAFDDLFSPQEHLCGSGVDKQIKPGYVNRVLGKPFEGDEPEPEDESEEDED